MSTFGLLTLTVSQNLHLEPNLTQKASSPAMEEAKQKAEAPAPRAAMPPPAPSSAPLAMAPPEPMEQLADRKQDNARQSSRARPTPVRRTG
ncbi:hypothetical protein [Corallococcus sp. 4LFB]|uniref:hypothetical protein n=1 Tax=Corallococcus sp. 4LFB TaxID=3383249 RepID=UPI0039764F5B